jgi:protein SCO1/2
MNTTDKITRLHLRTLLCALGFGIASMAHGADMGHDHAMHDHSMHDHAMHTAAPQAAAMENHEHHMQAMNQTGYQRAVVRYTLPTRQLTDSHGQPVDIAQLLDTDRPLAVNFIFTSCTTICPIMSATFAQAQRQLGADARDIQWISISIDPEYDTPERLSAYAQKLDADANWHFLTGDLDSIIAVQKAFAVYRGDKMNHAPTTLLRAGRHQPWVRLDGLTSSAELVQEYRQLAAASH